MSEATDASSLARAATWIRCSRAAFTNRSSAWFRISPGRRTIRKLKHVVLRLQPPHQENTSVMLPARLLVEELGGAYV